MVDECLAGFSCTAFAYGQVSCGCFLILRRASRHASESMRRSCFRSPNSHHHRCQTGTGKTFTMEGSLGSAKDHGIIPRAVASVFEKLEASGADFTVRISFLEIYQEQLEDLLEPSGNAGKGKSAAGAGGLRLVEDAKKGVQVLGLEEVGCADLPSAIALLQRGVQNRSTAATLCNKQSSRSHSVFTLKVVLKQVNEAGEEEVRAGQLNLVDLAGSECVGRSGAKNERAREAGCVIWWMNRWVDNG